MEMMTPAQRAAARVVYEYLGRNTRYDIPPIAELITAEYASIEQEKEHLKRALASARKDWERLKQCGGTLDELQQENQRLKKDLELADLTAAQEIDHLKQENQRLREEVDRLSGATGRKLSREAQQALATDKRG